MNTQNAFGIAVAVSTSLLGMLAPASAHEMQIIHLYTISHAECEAIENRGCVQKLTPGIQLKEYIKTLRTDKRNQKYEFDEYSVLEANGWDAYMLDEVVPVELYFKVLSI